MDTFVSLGLSRDIADQLAKRGITSPTRIQQQAIPAALKGTDIIGRSQTGTGKTLAYLLPFTHRVKADSTGTKVLIMTPTRELARQVFDVLRPFAETFGFDAADVIGGRTIENQLRKLKRSPHFIIGTPGRLLDHIRRHAVNLSSVEAVILDEADQMLAAGFREDIESIIDETPRKRQLLLFSATMPEEAVRLARKYMNHPAVIDAAPKVTASTVEQRIYMTTADHKFRLLLKHLSEMNPYMALVFCNTREEAHQLSERLAAASSLTVDEIHGDMTQSQRNHVIRNFEKAKIQVLVASDIAARGLDVEGVSHIFNYGIPRNLEYYVHRIGRTGRAGTKGIAITYATPEDALLLRRLEHSIQETITRYSESGDILKVKQPRPKRRVVTPGMYKPTKKKEHKALGHRGRNMRQRKKKEAHTPPSRRGR